MLESGAVNTSSRRMRVSIIHLKHPKGGELSRVLLGLADHPLGGGIDIRAAKDNIARILGV